MTYSKTWTIKSWRVTVAFSLIAIGISLLFHVWGDFGGHLVIGPFALIVEGPNVPNVEEMKWTSGGKK